MRANPLAADERYLQSLEAGQGEKQRRIDPWVVASPGDDILDIGTGGGSLAAYQARRFPDCRILAVDRSPAMLRRAQWRHGPTHNLRFVHASGDAPLTGAASTVILSSVLHEAYSNAGDDLGAVVGILKAARNQTKLDGRLVIRDFVRPVGGARIVRLRHRKDAIVPGHDFHSFVRQSPRRFPLYGVGTDARWRVYETTLAAAFEFLMHDNHHDLWRAELAERYGFWSLSEARTILEGLGLELVHAAPFGSRWWLAALTRGCATIEDQATGQDICLGAPQALLVARRRPFD